MQHAKPQLRRFVQISTDEVYGSLSEGSSKETDELRPVILTQQEKRRRPSCLQLLGYVWGPHYYYPRLEQLRTFQYPEKIIPLFITNALENEPLPLYGDGENYVTGFMC
ncbi:MAG: hypothetical protein CM1200mP25_2410 [Acidobacteriota bacterium]|nr:MAG: hypothetical protein CM1200mP25_2410 [Acidobacteriota bacterium]